jgi:hypothetical protein
VKPVSENPASSRARWLKQLHQWHWISSAISLIGMMLFAFTGITLNHAADIPSEPAVVQVELQLPAELMPELSGGGKAVAEAPLPDGILAWLDARLNLSLPSQKAEWSEDEIYLSLPRPGGDGWLRIDRSSGAVEFESTSRGWISYLNDLHKGRHTGTAWTVFLDVFSLACLVFSITGLLILKFHANVRASTWPLVSLGFVVPVLLLILFVH